MDFRTVLKASRARASGNTSAFTGFSFPSPVAVFM